MTDSYMARLGARLVDNGYPVLPIMPGTKKPGLFKGGAWRDYRGLDQARHASDLGARADRLERLAGRRHRHPDRHRDRRRHRHQGRRGAREPARAADPPDARRHAGGPVWHAPEAAARVPCGRAARRHEGAPYRGARARPAVRRLRRPSRHGAALRLAAGLAGRSAGRDPAAGRRDHDPRLPRSGAGAGAAGAQAWSAAGLAPQRALSRAPLAICAARPRRSPMRSGSSPMPTSTTTAGCGSAWRSRAPSARTAGLSSPPGPPPPARTCRSSRSRPGPASSPSGSAPARSITTRSPAAGTRTRRWC